MAMEAFLINPARRSRKRKVGKAKRKRRGGLPSALLSRMVRTYGIKKGMKEAWKQYRQGVRNPRPKLPAGYHVKGRKHRPVVYSGIRKGGYVRSPYSMSPKINPFGEEVMIVGNPRRKRRRSRRRNEPNPPRRRRRRSYSMRRNDPGRRRVRRSYKRRYRRNPARSTALQVSARRPMSLIVPAVAGTGGFFIADYVPNVIGMSASPLTRIGIKAGVAFGGGMVLSRFLGPKIGTAFAIGAGINAFNDILRTYIFGGTVTTGLGAFVTPQVGRRGMGAMNPYSAPMSPYQS